VKRQKGTRSIKMKRIRVPKQHNKWGGRKGMMKEQGNRLKENKYGLN
jgi:hypothetical protein